MCNQADKIFTIDLLLAISVIDGEEHTFSLHNEQLLINGKLNKVSCQAWPDVMQTMRANYFLEKIGLVGADLIILGGVWKQALQQSILSGLQLKEAGLNTLSTPDFEESTLGQWRKMIEARLMPHIPDMNYIEQLPPTSYQYEEEPLALFPLLHAWPKRLMNHPDWSCTEPPLPEIPPLPLDDVWVDLYVTEPVEESDLEDSMLSQAVERRYQENQWVSMPAEFVLERLKGTMVLVGAPGVGKTTLMKWIARRLIQQADGRFLLPLFVPLRAYALAKAQQVDLDILSFALDFCGICKKTQILKWSIMLSYLSGIGRNTVLFLLDGWDEVPQDMREILIGEIQRLGYGFSIIITSRPSAYPRALSADQFYEISDLPPENISKLILRWYQLMNQPQQADMLLKHLRKHPDLLRLARNPFLLNLLCAINMSGGLNNRSLPRNRTELYTHTLAHIYHYQTNKYPSSPFNRLHIAQTQTLALWLLTEAPNRPQYLFGSQEVEQVTGNKNLLPKVLNPSRLLSQWYMDRESLHFLHTSFQEYLAAEALLKQDKNKRITLINKELHNPAWQEIFRFIAGKNIEKDHDFWHIIRQLASHPDQCGLINIRLSQLIAETGMGDGGKLLLGYDLRNRLWEHIKSGIATDYFVQAYVQLDVKSYIDRVNTHEIRSSRLKARLIRSLGKIPSSQSSQTLLNCLLSNNLADAAVASYAIKNVLDVDAIKCLHLAILDETRSFDSRQILVRALGNSVGYASISFLVFLHNKVPELKGEILRVLGGIGGKECADALDKFLQQADSFSDQQAVINALGRAFDLSARKVLITMLARISPDDPLLEDILEALCEIPLSRHSELISIYLDSAFPETVQVQAVWALMEATETHITDKLADLGQSDRSEKVRIAALAALKKRARSIDFVWLSKRIRDESCDTVERANALEAIFGLYYRSKQGQLSLYFEHTYLHDQVLKLVQFSLKKTVTDINLTAVMGASVLGVDIAPILLTVCQNQSMFSESVKESACISLGKIKYQPAIPLFISWIEKSPDLPDDEEEALMDVDSRLARAAAQAYVQTDLINAAYHKLQTTRIAVSQFALENGYLIFADKVIAPNGRILGVKHRRFQQEWKLIPHIEAFEQQDKLRVICHYLLDNDFACLTSVYKNKKPIPLFKRTSDDLTNGIAIKTGKKLLEGGVIYRQPATMLMNRLKDNFEFVFSE